MQVMTMTLKTETSSQLMKMYGEAIATENLTIAIGDCRQPIPDYKHPRPLHKRHHLNHDVLHATTRPQTQRLLPHHWYFNQ
eukprot:scaffold20730_cov22-Cyclotella_meneghiniana.AAC.1